MSRKIPNLIPCNLSGHGIVEPKKVADLSVALRVIRMSLGMTQNEFVREFGKHLEIPGWNHPTTGTAISLRENTGQYLDYNQIENLCRAILNRNLSSVFPLLDKKRKEEKKKEKIRKKIQEETLRFVRAKFGEGFSVSVQVA